MTAVMTKALPASVQKMMTEAKTVMVMLAMDGSQRSCPSRWRSSVPLTAPESPAALPGPKRRTTSISSTSDVTASLALD